VQRGRVRTDRTLAFEAFYRAEVRVLLALAASLSGSRETGAEIAQEAMMRAFHRWDRVATLDSPGAWVRRVVINLSIDQHRRSGRERRAVARLAASAEASVESQLQGPFWTEVRALPPRQRAIVALRYVDDLDVKEIARVLNTSTGTVKKLLFVARRPLASRLAEEVSDANA
jgi:RNA polymerase sigma factor (sigma-70 family)